MVADLWGLMVADVSKWERERIMIPLQRFRSLIGPSLVFNIVGAGEFMLPLFACLYWCLDQHKCIAGIWLVPYNEVLNGCVKWLTQRPRPPWVDQRIELRAWSHEFSFPSSHSQLASALALWFVLASHHPEALTVTPTMPMVVFACLTGVSRVVLGLHYPSDVAVGEISLSLYLPACTPSPSLQL